MIANPYNPLEPATYFFGRAETFAFFRQNLVGTPHEHALVLTGRRGLGKSSVLHRLPYQIDDGYRLCIASLGTYDLSTEEALLVGLMEDIRLALEEGGSSTYRLPVWPLSEPDAPDLRVWFTTDFMEIALAALRGRHLLLALDDAHLLLEAIDGGDLPGDLLRYLADVLAAHTRLDIVCVLDEVFEDRALNTPLLNDPVLHFRLAEMSLDDARRVILEPVEGVVHYEGGLPDRILALAGGHPFLLHSICRLLFRRSEERNHSGPLTDHDLRAVMDAVMEQADEIFRPLWNTASQNEQIALAALVRLRDDADPITFDRLHDWLTGAGYAINRTQLAAALRSLDYQGLAQTEADTYRLPAELIAQWVEANADLPAPAVADSARDSGGRRMVPLVGLLAVILIVGGLGVAALAGAFDSDEDDPGPVDLGASTATLALNLEATRQSDFATQTEAARPTQTPLPSATPTDTLTPTNTLTPTQTPRPSATATLTATLTPTGTATSRPTRTPVPTDTLTPTPRITATLDPGD